MRYSFFPECLAIVCANGKLKCSSEIFKVSSSLVLNIRRILKLSIRFG